MISFDKFSPSQDKQRVADLMMCADCGWSGKLAETRHGDCPNCEAGRARALRKFRRLIARQLAYLIATMAAVYVTFYGIAWLLEVDVKHVGFWRTTAAVVVIDMMARCGIKFVEIFRACWTTVRGWYRA